jgi:DMSO reductase anchor subunit
LINAQFLSLDLAKSLLFFVKLSYFALKQIAKDYLTTIYIILYLHMVFALVFKKMANAAYSQSQMVYKQIYTAATLFLYFQ